MFAGSLSVKKRAFKPPSFRAKDDVRPVVTATTEALEPPAPVAAKPAAKRRRLLACPSITTRDLRRRGFEEPKPAAEISDEKGEALPGWCPRSLDDVSWSLKDDAQIVSACASGDLHQLQCPKAISMAVQPLVTRDTVLALQAHLVPRQLKGILPCCSQSSAQDWQHAVCSEEKRPFVGSEQRGAKAVNMVKPPTCIGKTKADKVLRQTKMEDFISTTSRNAEQKKHHSLPSATVSAIRHGDDCRAELDLSSAIAEQLIIQEDELEVIWRSPEKQLQEMMKAPALPFMRSLDMDFLKTIF